MESSDKKAVRARIDSYKADLEKEQVTAFAQLRYKYYADLYFDLARWLQAVIEQTDPSAGNMQVLISIAAGVLQKSLDHHRFSTDQRKESVIIRRWDKRSGRATLNEPLLRVLSIEQQLSLLEDIRQIHEFDPSCEVVVGTDGKLSTQLLDEQARKADIKIGLQYGYFASYFENLGRKEAALQIQEGRFTPRGENDFDQSVSVLQYQQFLSGIMVLEEYGIDPILEWKGKNYRGEILLHLISFFRAYSVKVEAPILLLTFENLLDHLNTVFQNRFSKPELNRHLNFLSWFPRCEEPFDPFLTPLLRSEDKLLLTTDALKHQNVWMPFLYRLWGNQALQRNKDGYQKKASASLVKCFEEAGFQVIAEYNIDEAGRTLTDLDIGAYKDDHLFLIEVKITQPRAQMREYRNHVRNKIKHKAVTQLDKVMSHLPAHWEQIKPLLNSDREWREMTVVPLIVSSSFEADRQVPEYIKLSAFELKRYLTNDPWVMRPEYHSADESVWTFYPPGGQISGPKLKELIDHNALWAFLDEKNKYL